MRERHDGEQVGGEDDVFGLYLDEVRRRPLLTRSEEQRLARAIEEGRRAERELDERDGDIPPERRRLLCELVARCEQSTRKFVEANLRLVISIAKRYRHARLPMSDLVQEGNLGLIHAVRKFDHEKGFRFSTYATWWIRQAITRAIANKGRLVRLPVDAGLSLNRINGTRARLEAELKRPPTIDEVAAELEMAPTRVVDLLASGAEAVSVSEPLGGEDGPELGETLPDPLAEQSLENALASMVPAEVERLLDLLDERARRIVCLRFGFDGHAPRSRAAVGECLGISGERVRQVEAQALARLRARPETGQLWEALSAG